MDKTIAKEAKKLLTEMAHAPGDWELGELICRAVANGVSPRDMAAKLGFSTRKAIYLMTNYGHGQRAGVTRDEANSLGWSKLKEIAPYMTERNKKQMMKVADRLTVVQVGDFVRGLINPHG